MKNFAWRFPILDDGDEQGINDSGIATFKGSELYDNLAREICQNSLDAKDEAQETVIVEFSSKSLKKNEYSALVGLDTIFTECETYWQKRMEPKLQGFLNEAKTKLAADQIDFLVIRDFNTTGLSGAKAAAMEKSVWRALTHSNGVTQKGQGSAGSHGIGKNAPFACSSFRTVFYNSYAKEDGVKAFQGVARLVTHIHDGTQTQGVGFFLNVDDRKPIFGDESCLLRDQFHRDSFGTDVIIAGFKKTDTWVSDIEKAVLSNFFVAILNKKLIVRIEGQEINEKTIAARLKHYAEIEKKQDLRDKKITTIMELYETVTNPDETQRASILTNDDVILYLKKDDKYSRTVAEMRSIGMVIRTRHKTELARYAAVMIVTGAELNELLKTIEPPQHNKWDPELLETVSSKERASKITRSLVAWTNDRIIDFCRCDLPEEIDLDGVSAYLPYDDNDVGLGKDEIDDKSPDAVNRPEKAEKNKARSHTITLTAAKVKGNRNEDYTPLNETGGGTKHGLGGTPDPNGLDEVKAPISGDKAIAIPKVLSQRIIQMPAASVYRVALMLEEDCPLVHISLKVLGDDGTKEPITIKEYKIAKTRIQNNSRVIILHDLKGKTLYEVFLTLAYSEKMLLELLIY